MESGFSFDSAILLSISVSFAFCQRTRGGQNMRSPGESSQRSCSRRKDSFENTSPPPRRTKDINALHVHAVCNNPLHLKTQGISNTDRRAYSRCSSWRVDDWKLCRDDHFTSLVARWGKKHPRSQSFPTDDSKAEYLPRTAMWWAMYFWIFIKHLRNSHQIQSISWASHS